MIEECGKEVVMEGGDNGLNNWQAYLAYFD